ncbi:MAG: serine hydrolase domain-containing protein [Vicinamibacterales bacterium]
MLRRSPRLRSFRWLLPALTLLAGVPLVLPVAARQADDGDTQMHQLAIGQYLREYRQRHHLPGLSVAVVRNRTVLHVAGYGQTASHTALTPSTPMPVASLSKSFTSLAVMQLVEAGAIDLDTPITKYLPDFAVDDPRGGQITLRHALTHTSGLSDATFHEKSGPLPATLEAGVQMLRQARLVSDPGTARHYHNPNYWIAARVVEVMSGEPFGAYLTRHVFEPLDMTSTRSVGRLDQPAQVDRGFIRLFTRPLARPEPAWFLEGASGVISDAHDMARWLIMQVNDGTAANGRRLISRQSLDRMHAGLGWTPGRLGSIATVEHPGWMFTFTAHQLLVPSQGYGIAVMSNVGLGLAPVDSEVIAHALVEVLNARTPDTDGRVDAMVDAAFAALTLLLTVAAMSAVARAPAWAARRHSASVGRQAAGVLPWFLPLLLLAALAPILGVVFAGRDASFAQMVHVVPSLVVCLVVLSVIGLLVSAVRLRALRRGPVPTLPAGRRASRR